MWIERKVLEGQFVSLEPLSEDHVKHLEQAVEDGESWKLWYANVPKVEEIHDYVKAAIVDAQKGNVAYVVRSKITGKIVGTTRYYNVDEHNKRAMIGYTWYAASVRRTPINTESKFLLLKYLFEELEAIAVEFRTHFFNQASRAAIERLGAKQDGILRNHQIIKNGSYRDTVVYSIIENEWPAVKTNLLSKLSH